MPLKSNVKIAMLLLRVKVTMVTRTLLLVPWLNHDVNLVAPSGSAFPLLQVLHRIDERVSIFVTAVEQNAALRTLGTNMYLHVIPFCSIGSGDTAPVLRVAQFHPRSQISVGPDLAKVRAGWRLVVAAIFTASIHGLSSIVRVAAAGKHVYVAGLIQALFR
jgi:hypothetical protein